MLVKDVMAKDLAFCTPQQGVIEAARLMKTEDVGAIPVVQDEKGKKLIGIITDRDICVGIVAAGKNANEVKIDSLMSRDLVTAKPDDDLERCADLMKRSQVRRIPITDKSGILVGIVAQADLAQESESAETVKETVKQVSRPGGQKKEAA